MGQTRPMMVATESPGTYGDALQFALAYGQLAGFGNVSALAHLGGAFVGLAAWIGWRK